MAKQGNTTGPAISVITLGCSKNIVDSEVLLRQLHGAAGRIVEDVDDADIAVINTCGFIEAAKRESIDAILEAVERKNGGRLKKVVVMGCLSERYRDDLAREIPDVDFYFGSNQLREVVTALGVDFRRELLGERKLTTPSHFAYLKISEGCDRPCSFCAIPLMRGGHRTKPHEDILSEAEGLVAGGVRELILIGQDTTFYGIDLYGERRLHPLLNDLAERSPSTWIRLMYAYPAGFPLDVLEVYRNHPAICRYLDIPLQHISDAVLKSMRRGIDSAGIRKLLEAIKTAVPGIALRTTLIVGYPGESDRDFQELYDFVSETRFHRLGVFTYSHEEGTTAAPLGDPIPAQVKEERLGALMELQKGISESRNRELVGSSVRVLVDRLDGEFAVGRTEWDAPEIDQEVYVRNPGTLSPGNFCDVRVVDATEYDLHADVGLSGEGKG